MRTRRRGSSHSLRRCSQKLPIQSHPHPAHAYRADPFAAEAAADRLLRHYHKLNDRPNAERVMKAFGATLKIWRERQNPMMSSIFLPRIIERYQPCRKGSSEDAERAQVARARKGEEYRSRHENDFPSKASSKKRTLTISSAKLVLPQVISGYASLTRNLVCILCQTLTQRGRCWSGCTRTGVLRS